MSILLRVNIDVRPPRLILVWPQVSKKKRRLITTHAILM